MLKKYILYIFLCSWSGILSGQDQHNIPPAATTPVFNRAISEDVWAKVEKGLDYSTDQPQPEKKQKKLNSPQFPEPRWNPGQGWGVFFQVLAIIAVVLALIYAFYRIMQAPRNSTLASDGVQITLENLDKYLHESDLDRFLKEALSTGNYTLAIRLYYLQVIKNLSIKQAIHWAQQKTNRDYIREMREHRLHTPFKQVTRQYERVWYGNSAIGLNEYNQLEPEFKQLLQSIG
jgi:hypothetical protein